MSGKYMKLKRVIIPTITMILLVSQLMGCSATDTQQAMNMLQESEQIELEYTVPEYGTNIGDDQTIEQGLFWTQLASLESHPDLRAAFEEQLNVRVNEDGTKYGIIYTDENGEITQNNTLLNALGNKNFTDYLYTSFDDEAFETIALNEYTDLEDNEVLSAIINAYFEVLPDATENEFNGSATISRAQAMTLVMRATTPVNEAQAPDEDTDFTAAVGKNQYANFAAPMNDYAFINTSNMLNETTFNGTMTIGEYIYLLTNALFNDSYAEKLSSLGMEDTSLNSTLSTIKDAGDITIQEAIKNPENGIPTDMYSTLARAVALGFIDEDSLNWDDAITKSDAIGMFIAASITYYSTSQYITFSHGFPEGLNSEGLTANEAKKISGDYVRSQGHNTDTWKEYARSQGADTTEGEWWIYYYGGATNKTERSYAINQRTGEKIVAGPYTYFYGTSHDDDGVTFFLGGDNIFPGDEKPEFEQNMMLYTLDMLNGTHTETESSENIDVD